MGDNISKADQQNLDYEPETVEPISKADQHVVVGGMKAADNINELDQQNETKTVDHINKLDQQNVGDETKTVDHISKANQPVLGDEESDDESPDTRFMRSKKRMKAIDRESFILMFAMFFIIFHLIELILSVTIDKVVYNISMIAILIEATYETALIILNIALLLGTWHGDRPGLIIWLGGVIPLLIANLAWRIYRVSEYKLFELVECIIDLFIFVAYLFVWPKVHEFNKNRKVIHNRIKAERIRELQLGV